MNVSPYAHKLVVPVIDRTGQSCGFTRDGNPIGRTILNSAMSFLYPDEEVVFINWLWNQEQDYKLSEAELDEGVHYKGKLYWGKWGWGSSVKHGVTIGMRHDILKDSGLGKKSEHGQRVGRWLLPNAQYGAVTGNLKVLYVPKGQLFNGLPIEDGNAYMTQALAAVLEKSRELSGGAKRLAAPNEANDSHGFTQRVRWTPEVEAETLPYLKEALDNMDAARHGDMLPVHQTASLADRYALCEIDKDMVKHPFVANSLRRSAKAQAVQLATSIPTKSHVYVAVPTTLSQASAWGKHILTRYPIDSWAGMKALDLDAQGAAEPVDEEIERISKMGVAQYTLASHTIFDKGMAGIVEDSLLDGYDMVICAENIKMGGMRRLAKGNQRFEIELDGVYLGLVMRYEIGKAFGVNTAMWEIMGGDFDGDNVIVTDCESRPALWWEVSQNPYQESHKLEKTSHWWAEGDKRPEMIVRSTLNLVGFVTNVMAHSFAMRDRATLLSAIGMPSEEITDIKLSKLIKIGTDLYKVLGIDVKEVWKEAAQLQSALIKALGRGVPWVSWANSDEAFVHSIPEIWDGPAPKDRKNKQYVISLPSAFDGTVATIAKLMLPQLQGFLKARIEAKPLVAYRRWAPNPGKELEDSIKPLTTKFSFRVVTVNFSDEEDVLAFKAWWNGEVNTWMAEHHIDRTQAAYAMWWSTHSSQSANASAAAVFYAFPDEVELIVRNKPGRIKASAVRTIALGLNPLVEQATDQVEVEEIVTPMGKRDILRKAIRPKDKALLAEGKELLYIPVKDVEQPECGSYQAFFTKKSAGSWWVVLS